MKDEELFKAWKSEQYKDQSTEERLEFVEHLHTFPKYFEKTFLAGLKAGRPQWHELDWEKDFPKADKLIRVRLRDGMEHICETCYYEPAEDEIGYGKLLINFYELNGEWVDDNDVIAWCEIPTFDKE